MQELKTVTEIVKYGFNSALVIKRDWPAIRQFSPQQKKSSQLLSDVLLLVHKTNLCYNLFVHFQGSETVSLQGR